MSDALNVAISINFKLKEKMNHPFILDTLINDTWILSQGDLTMNVIDSFLSFLTKYDERKIHSMLSQMLDPRFKSLRF